MKRISSVVGAWVLAISAVILPAAPASAQTEAPYYPAPNELPPGPWQSQCFAPRFEGQYLVTNCDIDSGGSALTRWDMSRSFGPLIVCSGDLTDEANCYARSRELPGNALPGGPWRQFCDFGSWQSGPTIIAMCLNEDNVLQEVRIDARVQRRFLMACDLDIVEGSDGSVCQSYTPDMVLSVVTQPERPATPPAPRPQPVANDGMPAGSWRNTCSGARLDGVILRAHCLDNSGERLVNVHDTRSSGGALINCNGVLSSMPDCDARPQSRDGLGLPEGTWRTTCRLRHWNYTSIAAGCYDRNRAETVYSEVEIGGWNGPVLNCDGLLWGSTDCAAAGTRQYQSAPQPQPGPAPTPASDPNTPPLPGGNWSQSCRDGRVERGVFYATCRRPDGSWNEDNQRLQQMSDTFSNCHGGLFRGNACPALPPGPWQNSCRVTGWSEDQLFVECWRAAYSRPDGGGGYYEEPAAYHSDAIYYRRYAGQSFVNCARDLRLGTQCPN